MIIKSKRGNEYEVDWQQEGYSYADANVYVYTTKKFLWLIPYKGWKKVWQSGRYRGPIGNMTLIRAEKLHKDTMIKWFEYVVEEYEQWAESWGKL